MTPYLTFATNSFVVGFADKLYVRMTSLYSRLKLKYAKFQNPVAIYLAKKLPKNFHPLAVF